MEREREGENEKEKERKRERGQAEMGESEEKYLINKGNAIFIIVD